MAKLREMAEKVQSVYGMVERYATTRDEKEAQRLAMPLKRAFGRLKIELMGAGLDTLSQLAGAMEIAAGRGGSQRRKSRILREGVGSMKHQVDQEQRRLVTEDQAIQAREEREAREKEAREKGG